MLEFLLLSENLPFAVSLGLLIIIAILEGVGTLLGSGLSSLLGSVGDGLSPELDIDLDIDGPELHATGLFTKLFAWLRVGKVPIIMLLLAFLCVFTISGLIIQKSAFSANSELLPNWIAGLLAFFVSLPAVRYIAVALEIIMPGDETSAVSRDSFIGRNAIITTGQARENYPAEARLKDVHGQTHYVMVEPSSDITIKQGEWIQLKSKKGAHFVGQAINPEQE